MTAPRGWIAALDHEGDLWVLGGDGRWRWSDADAPHGGLTHRWEKVDKQYGPMTRVSLLVHDHQPDLTPDQDGDWPDPHGVGIWYDHATDPGELLKRALWFVTLAEHLRAKQATT